MPNSNTSARNEETECFSLSFVSLSIRSTRKGNDGNDKERNQPLKRAIHQRMTGRLSFLFPPNVRTEEPEDTGTGRQPFIVPNRRRMSPPMGGSKLLLSLTLWVAVRLTIIPCMGPSCCTRTASGDGAPNRRQINTERTSSRCGLSV